jgi:RNA polymerase sigma factor (sigma-70 family)
VTITLMAHRPLRANGPHGGGSGPGRASPCRQAAQHEQEVLLADVLAKLPENYREVIALRNLEGLFHEEVAMRMGRSGGAVRMLWSRAMEWA